MNFTEDASTVNKLPFTFSLMFQLCRESGWRSLFAGKSGKGFFIMTIYETEEVSITRAERLQESF